MEIFSFQPRCCFRRHGSSYEFVEIVCRPSGRDWIDSQTAEKGSNGCRDMERSEGNLKCDAYCAQFFPTNHTARYPIKLLFLRDAFHAFWLFCEHTNTNYAFNASQWLFFGRHENDLIFHVTELHTADKFSRHRHRCRTSLCEGHAELASSRTRQQRSEVEHNLILMDCAIERRNLMISLGAGLICLVNWGLWREPTTRKLISPKWLRW